MPPTTVFQSIAFLLIATVLEVSGDAIIRIAFHNHTGLAVTRIALFALGAAFVFGYGTFLNIAPLEFREVIGIYVATLFIVWQVVNFAFFRTTPTAPILVGGSLIILGGTVLSFWKP